MTFFFSCATSTILINPTFHPFLCQTEGRGWGVRCVQPLHANDLIVEYCGEVIDQDESDRRLAEMKTRGEQNFYLFFVSQDHV
jgi:SET domain-containing protein